MSVDVLTVGEAMTAIRPDGLLRLGGRATISVAGAESNLAVGLARLGHDVAWSGRVGTDESGELVLRTLAAEGVGTSTVVRDATAPTGLFVLERRLPGVTRVEYHRGRSAGAAWGPADVEGALALAPRLVHVTGVTPALSESARAGIRALVTGARDAGALVSLDVNFRSRLWSREAAAAFLAPLARSADVVLASADELALVADRPTELLDAGVGEVVVKQGEHGASAVTAHGEVSEPAHRVPVVDPVGAGDAFAAGYLSALLDGEDVGVRLRRGNAAGAFAVASSGDWEGLPTRAELDLVHVAVGESLR